MITSADPLHLPVCYATASSDAVVALVTEHYDLNGPLNCALLNRGFNDIYALSTDTGERFILRLSGPRARGPADVGAETAFLAYLDAANIPVAAAVPTRDGKLFTSANLPDGLRATVLFRYAEGRRPDLDALDDARVQGITLARLHQVADGYPDRKAGRYQLGLDHLLHRQVAEILPFCLNTPQTQHDLLSLAERIATSVASLGGDLAWTRCHGDCHGSNARIATTGPWAGQAVFFDFDDGGYGYLAYDLAVHLWAQVAFGRQRHAVWHAFRIGYQSVRAVTPEDEAAIPWFVAIRHIWLIGEYAARTAEWGREILSSTWLNREIRFLLTWERDHLLSRLL